MSKLLKSIIITSTIAFTANALATAEAPSSASNTVEEKPVMANEENKPAPTADEQKKHNEKHKKKHKAKKKHKEHKHDHKEHKHDQKDEHKDHEGSSAQEAPAASAAPTAPAASEE